ncbi:MAG: SIMPL domain-containing protein [Pseudomonadota bacterium]
MSWRPKMFEWVKLGAFAGFFALVPLALSADTSARRITVVGEGSVSVVPDMLVVTLTVQVEDDDASGALRKMSAQLDDVFAKMVEAGITEADTQTSGLSLSPRYDNNRSLTYGGEIIGFVAASNVTIVSRDLSKSGDVLDAVVAAGVSQINGLQFDVQDPDPFIEEARRAAVADALAKTALYAEAADVSLGTIQSVSETSGYGGGPQPFETFEARSVPIAAGTQDITARVTIVTAIE